MLAVLRTSHHRRHLHIPQRIHQHNPLLHPHSHRYIRPRIRLHIKSHSIHCRPRMPNTLLHTLGHNRRRKNIPRSWLVSLRGYPAISIARNTPKFQDDTQSAWCRSGTNGRPK